jgi:hypothetical protein
MEELNTLSLPDFVKLGNVIFLKGLDSVPQVARTSGIFKEESISANTGNTREYSSIDLEEYASKKGEGEQAKRAKKQQGYTKFLTAYRVAKDIGITYEMRSQNKYQEVVSRLTNLGDMAAKRMDLDLTHRLTFGLSTSYTDMDGQAVDVTIGDTLALFSTVHTVKGSSTTYRNILANNPQFSLSSLEGIQRLATEETINQFGQKMTMPFDIIFSTDDPNTVNSIRQVLLSTASVNAGENSGVLNPLRGMYKHVILPRLATDANGAVDSTKRKYWGIVSSMFSSAYLGIWEAPHMKMPANLNAGEDFSTDDWNFGVRAGYGITIVDGAFIKFSSGLGTA